MTSTDQAKPEDLAPWIRATLDEYARAIRDLETVVHRITETQYITSTSLADDEFPHLEAIMEHVAGAGNRYVDYLETALTGEDVTKREHEFVTDTPRTVMKSVWDAFKRTEEVMRLAIGRSDDVLCKLRIVTRWEQEYDLEQMLEHAIVHILRHRRQVERWLALM